MWRIATFFSFKVFCYFSKLQELFHFVLDSSEIVALQAHWDIVRLLDRNMVEMKKN